MGIASFSGASSVIKPGVVTSSTRPSAPFVGQLIYDTTVAQTLAWNGSAWIGAAGKIGQVQSTFKADAFSTTSTSFVDVTDLSVSITPIATTSRVLIMAYIASAGSTSNNYYLNLNRDSTAICQTTSGSIFSTARGYVSTAAGTLYTTVVFLDSPATTSATTYKIQAKVGSDTMYVNRRGSDTLGSTSTITVMEVLA